MLEKIELSGFRSFKSASLDISAFTIVIGENASGKSNLRDAFKVLHAASSGMSILEMFGEKLDNSNMYWSGIRGNADDIFLHRHKVVKIKAFIHTKALNISADDYPDTKIAYEFEIVKGNVPIVRMEKIKYIFPFRLEYKLSTKIKEYEKDLIDTSSRNPLNNPSFFKLKLIVDPSNKYLRKHIQEIRKLIDSRNAKSEEVSHLIENMENESSFVIALSQVGQHLQQIRFLDLDPISMRRPSRPGISRLGDRGENLASCLFDLYQDFEKQDRLVSWLNEFIAVEAQDIEFEEDFEGNIVGFLLEKNGRRTSFAAVSDGTLRFLAIMVVFLYGEGGETYIFEEIENGIHPSRLKNLIQFIESRNAEHPNIRVIATTHSPTLLDLLGEKTLNDAYIIYRDQENYSKLKKITEFESFGKVREKNKISELYVENWFENIGDLE